MVDIRGLNEIFYVPPIDWERTNRILTDFLSKKGEELEYKDEKTFFLWEQDIQLISAFLEKADIFDSDFQRADLRSSLLDRALLKYSAFIRLDDWKELARSQLVAHPNCGCTITPVLKTDFSEIPKVG